MDKQALIAVYEEHNPGIYRYAYRLLGSPELAEDCVSETFSRFLQSLPRRREPLDNIKAYLYRIAHNYITDHYRRQPPPAQPLETWQPASPEANPAQQVDQQMQVEQVRQALLSLPPDQQRVIQLRFLEDWPHAEVAEALGKTNDATRALQSRALAALRRMLIDSEERPNHEPKTPSQPIARPPAV